MAETLRAPEARRPMPVGLLPAVRGEHVVVVNGEGSHYGYVAWSDLYVNSDGDAYVDVVAERDWWAAEFTGARPQRVQAWPAAAVFAA